MNTKKPFIFTLDEEVAEHMKNLGYQLISDNVERFVFENCTRLHFDSSIDTDKIGYSDMLFM